eukprot:gb/GECH01000388.1/.p1 GENE.gb/GECH01000388.1/~~gb/GECH01000388.1/.p1  ORF type:complete len:360 (+),score=77.72 gb/GECH01000388.1/:1-1080(+)
MSSGAISSNTISHPTSTSSHSSSYSSSSSSNSSSPSNSVENSLENSEREELQPFLFQVSGHGGILRVSGNRLYKPLIPREHKFYTSLSEDSPLHNFIPKFYGTTTITRELVDEQHSSDSIQSAAQVENVIFTDDSSPWVNTAKQRHNGNPVESSETLKHWNTVDREFNYVILEDLTGKFKRPSVLDIKMGTRQHGFATSPTKAASLEAKCKKTTTAQLGIRHCGTQVYRRDQCRYLLRDKYFGRKLTQNTLNEALEEYFDNGETIMCKVIPGFLQRLQKLLEVFENNRSHHFFSSSLLFVYEGDSDDPSFDLRMVDFAHVYQTKEPLVPDEHDEGYILGLKNLIHILNSIYEKHQNKSA